MNEQMADTNRGQRARNRRRRFFALVVVIALIVSIGAGATYSLFRGRPDGGTTANPPVGSTPPDPTYKGINILLLGVDQRPGDFGRSDTMLLLSLDPDAGRIHVMSIPRDTMIDLPGHGREKINAAYAYGGPNLAKQAVADLLGLPVNYYVRVNLQGFVRLVDLAGGVDINVKEKMDYEDPFQGLFIHLKPGMQHMDGATALGYVRFRGDWRADLGRIDRQQGFLKALGQQVLTPSILPKLPSLIGQTAKMVSTDIPATDKLALAVSGYRYYHNGTDMTTLPGEAKYIDGISYFIADTGQLQAELSSWMAN